MADVLTVQDLEVAKKHDTFHSEVITGKAGGSAIGAEIDTATNAVTGQIQTTLPKVLRDVGFKPASFTFVTGGTLGVADADKCIYNPAPAGDDNWYSWSGALPHAVDPGTDPTLPGGGYVPRTDVVLREQLNDIDGANLVGGATYAQIRAYAGTATKIDCIGKTSLLDGANGKFVADLSDTTSVDNDATVLVSASGVRWKRQYSGMIQPEWAGALRNTPSADCTAAIQKCLTIGPTEIAADFYAAGTLEINEGQSLIFTGGQLLQKTNATTTLRVNYGGEARDVLINTSTINMDGTEAVPVIEITPWDTPTKTKTTKVTGRILGNFPNLQGIGVRLFAKTTSAEQVYSLIQFAHVDVSVYGLRDALVIDVTQFATDDIVYVNSSYIKVYSKNCYRPVQLLNNAALAQILSGNCNIADNDFIFGGQHYVGSEVFCKVDGGTSNRITVNPSDWNAAFWIDFTGKSVGNTVDGSIPIANASKINDASGKNRVKRREEIAAQVVFDGILGSMSFASGGSVEKTSVGSYTFRFDEPFSNANSYIAFAQGNNFGESTNYPISIVPTAARGSDYCVFNCRRTDTGALVDIPGISFMAVGR